MKTTPELYEIKPLDWKKHIDDNGNYYKADGYITDGNEWDGFSVRLEPNQWIRCESHEHGKQLAEAHHREQHLKHLNKVEVHAEFCDAMDNNPEGIKKPCNCQSHLKVMPLTELPKQES